MELWDQVMVDREAEGDDESADEGNRMEGNGRVQICR